MTVTIQNSKAKKRPCICIVSIPKLTKSKLNFIRPLLVGFSSGGLLSVPLLQMLIAIVSRHTEQHLIFQRLCMVLQLLVVTLLSDIYDIPLNLVLALPTSYSTPEILQWQILSMSQWNQRRHRVILWLKISKESTFRIIFHLLRDGILGFFFQW